MRRLLLLLLLVTPAGSQDPGSLPPGAIRGDPSKAKPDPRALGALGGEGIVPSAARLKELRVGAKLVGIEVTSLIPGGAGAAADLREGDLIVAVDGKSLAAKKGASPVLRLVELLERPRGRGKAARLKVLRDGKATEVEVLVEGTVKPTRGWPVDCPRATAIRDAALAKLVEMQAADGSLPTQLGGDNGKTAVTTLAGLAWLAAGSTPTDGTYAEPIRKCRDWLLKHGGREDPRFVNAGGRNWSQVNWSLGYAPQFLARVQRLDPQPEVATRLEEMRDAIVANQEPSGGWAHGPRNELPYPLDYAELAVVGDLLLASLGEIQRAGIEIPKEPVGRAIAYLEETSDGGGGIGYSTRPGQKGMGDAGRTAGALFAMARLGLTKKPLYKKLAGYLRRHLERLPGGHVSPDMHLLFGALACHELGKKDWKAYAQAFRIEILSLANGDGTFGVRPADTSRSGLGNTDRTMGPAWRTATFALILSLPLGHLSE